MFTSSMRKTLTIRRLLFTLAALTLPAAAQTPDTLKFALVFARHGVRSPTKPNSVLDRYSAQPWPVWGVEPGELTPHGAHLLELVGAFDRLWLNSEHLLAPEDCPASGQVFLLADTDHRNIDSTRALARGLAPGCDLPVHVQTSSPVDPIFHFLATAAPTDAQRQQAQQALTARIRDFSTGSYLPALGTLARLLNPAPGNGKLDLLAEPVAVKPGKSDHLADVTGPLATASSLSENFLLEYADNMPRADVGWGRLQPETLRQLITLHTAYFDLVHRTPALARAESSNLLQRILFTLEQAATGTAIPGAIGPPGARFVLLDGHDTNLAGLAALLGLHWTLDGRTDDTPPGVQLTFELRENPKTKAQTIRLVYRMQTLDQLREATPLTPGAPPATQLLAQPACGTRTACPLDQFLRGAQKTIAPEFVQRSFPKLD